MESRELGLVLARSLLDIEDLHYGWWDPEDELSFNKLPEAQQRYTNELLARIEAQCPDGGVSWMSVAAPGASWSSSSRASTTSTASFRRRR